MSLKQTVCTTALCKSGRAAVSQMLYTFDYLRAQYTKFNAGSFQPTVQALKAQLESVDSWYADMIPFNPTCCTIDDIGRQADTLTNQMLASVGAANVPPPPPATNWGNLIVFGGVALVLVAYAPQIKAAMKK